MLRATIDMMNAGLRYRACPPTQYDSRALTLGTAHLSNVFISDDHLSSIRKLSCKRALDDGSVAVRTNVLRPALRAFHATGLQPRRAN